MKKINNIRILVVPNGIRVKWTEREGSTLRTVRVCVPTYENFTTLMGELFPYLSLNQEI